MNILSNNNLLIINCLIFMILIVWGEIYKDPILQIVCVIMMLINGYCWMALEGWKGMWYE